MARIVTYEASVAAAAQFLGTEFKIQPKNDRSVLMLRELDLQMGTESKTFRIVKRNPSGQQVALVQQSIDNTGAPAPSTAESVVLKGDDVELLFSYGDQIQITTSGATSAMRAKLYFLELDPDELLSMT
jgi:hypothetical protein